jgi:arsenate reductase (glutaredoxin)
MQVTIYHNSRCSKSRRALALLEERGIQPRVVDYLKYPPEPVELRRLLTLMDLAPMDLVRRNESAFKEAGLDCTNPSDDMIVDAMVANPVLIERPIVVVDDARAVIGRPPERVLELL